MRYIIIEKTKGIFLGSHHLVPLYSNAVNIPVIKVYSFESREEATYYIEYLKKSSKNFSVHEIEYHEKYIPIDILIKKGYSKYTEKMLSYYPMSSIAIH
jgi:hypothetical protein